MSSKNGKVLTFKTASEKYIADLTTEGSKDGTVSTYTRCLVNCAGFFGVDTPIADITPKTIESFLASDALLKKPNGNPKTAITILQNTRVVRQLLDWAKAKGHIAENPFPAKPVKEPKAPKEKKAPKDKAPVATKKQKAAAAAVPAAKAPSAKK